MADTLAKCVIKKARVIKMDPATGLEPASGTYKVPAKNQLSYAGIIWCKVFEAVRTQQKLTTQ